MSGIPASVSAEGTRRVVFVEGGVADRSAVTLGEVAGGDELSCYLTGQGWQPTRDQASIADDRYCASQSFERPGRKSAGLTLQYVWNGAEPGDDVARLTLTAGVSGDLVHILQKPEDEDNFTVGDFYEVWPIVAGEQVVMPPEQNSVDRIQQKVFVTGPVSGIHELVSGS